MKKTFSLASLVATAMILASCGGSSDSSAQTCDSLIASKTTWAASNICSDGYSQEISATFNSDGTYTSYRDNSIGNGVWECSNNTLVIDHEDIFTVASNYFEASDSEGGITCNQKIY